MNDKRTQEWSEMADHLFTALNEVVEKAEKIQVLLMRSETPSQEIFTQMYEFVALADDAKAVGDNTELWHKLNEIEDFVRKPRLEVVSDKS